MLNKKTTIRVIKDLSSLMVFGFLAFSMYQILFPAASSDAASTATAEIDVEVEPVIEMAIDKTTLALAYNNETEILPTSAGVLATGQINVYVSTNNSNGYTLKLYTQDSTNAMTHINSNVTANIPSITSSSASLSKDHWGFKAGNASDWRGIGANASSSAGLITENGSSTGFCDNLSTNYDSCYSAGTAEKNTITFGANISDSLPAGTYTNNVVFSTIANPSSVNEE